MDTLDDSENNAKISDSAYSNSCSNSQSRRSHSSKSTHSGSHSSASSGYGGKPSTSGCGNTITCKPPEKRLNKKDNKKKKYKLKPPKPKSKIASTQPQPKCVPPEPVKEFKVPKKETIDVGMRSSPSGSHAAKGVENMNARSTAGTSQEQVGSENNQSNTGTNAKCRTSNINVSHNFSCVLSMHDGVVLYTTATITPLLGYPKEMLNGRSFLDFVHERDRNVFATQITSRLAVPKMSNGMPLKAITQLCASSSLVCRLRRYRGLAAGFALKETKTMFTPFQLKLSLKRHSNLSDLNIYLVVRATPFFTAFHTSHEVIPKAVPFVIRHYPNGNLEFIDPESVPYLGYIPHELINKNALQLYHPHDLDYLQQVYETTIREGSTPRGCPFRMMVQNGDYITLETEWSTFVNPWSKKLEFMIGKHYVIEGPKNFDVYEPPVTASMLKLSEEDKARTQCMRENILRILNDTPTKSELTKKPNTYRGQAFAELMERLIEDTPKRVEEPRMDITHEIDTSYYDRDSLLLGAISPHHDFNDGRSSTGTSCSYNQLNYEANLQRYFDKHQSYDFDGPNTMSGDRTGFTDRMDDSGNTAPPLPRHTRSGGEGSSKQSRSNLYYGSVPPNQPYIHHRLTESLLRKHNAEMEKELIRMHRETPQCSRTEKEKTILENRQRKKEHLARCNASFQPTSAARNIPQQAKEDIYNVPRGVKRTKKTSEDGASAHKQPCTSTKRQERRWPTTTTTTSATTVPTSPVVTSALAAPWPAPREDKNVNSFLGMNVPRPVPLLSAVNAVPAIVPMYYTSAMNRTPTTPSGPPNQPGTSYQATPVPCMMVGGTMYGSPIMYAPVNAPPNPPSNQRPNQPPNQPPHPPPNPMAEPVKQCHAFASILNPLTLICRNYDELRPKLSPNNGERIWRQKREFVLQSRFIRNKHRYSDSSSSADNSCGSTEVISDVRRRSRSKKSSNNGERTDGESSYYSLFSSFFKTESGSNDDSDNRKSDKDKWSRPWSRFSQTDDWYGKKKLATSMPRRSMYPPWMDQVSVTPDLVYRYQVANKNLDEVLSSDKERLNKMEQPKLVNDQLDQLYLDLQLQGFASKLSLEEGITSSSSSEEDNLAKTKKGKGSDQKMKEKQQGKKHAKNQEKKKDYSKMVMIHEEDAPFPPPDDGPVAPNLYYEAIADERSNLIYGQFFSH